MATPLYFVEFSHDAEPHYFRREGSAATKLSRADYEAQIKRRNQRWAVVDRHEPFVRAQYFSSGAGEFKLSERDFFAGSEDGPDVLRRLVERAAAHRAAGGRVPPGVVYQIPAVLLGGMVVPVRDRDRARCIELESTKTAEWGWQASLQGEPGYVLQVFSAASEAEVGQRSELLAQLSGLIPTIKDSWGCPEKDTHKQYVIYKARHLRVLRKEDLVNSAYVQALRELLSAIHLQQVTLGPDVEFQLSDFVVHTTKPNRVFACGLDRARVWSSSPAVLKPTLKLTGVEQAATFSRQVEKDWGMLQQFLVPSPVPIAKKPEPEKPESKGVTVEAGTEGEADKTDENLALFQKLSKEFGVKDSTDEFKARLVAEKEAITKEAVEINKLQGVDPKEKIRFAIHASRNANYKVGNAAGQFLDAYIAKDETKSTTYRTAYERAAIAARKTGHQEVVVRVKNLFSDELKKLKLDVVTSFEELVAELQKIRSECEQYLQVTFTTQQCDLANALIDYVDEASDANAEAVTQAGNAFSE